MSDLELLKNIVDKIKPKIGAVDTETTGLHIINDKQKRINYFKVDSFISLRCTSLVCQECCHLLHHQSCSQIQHL